MFANMLRATQREYFNKLKKAKAAASPHKPTFADGARLPCAFPVHSINKEASRPRTLSSKPIAPNETMLRASLVLLALIAAHGLPTSHRPSAHATESGERRIANARALDAELDSLSRDLEAEVGHPDKYSEDGIVIVHGKNPAEADLERAAVPPVGGIVAKFGSYNFENGAGLGAIYGAAADADHTTGSLGRRVDGRRLRVSATAVHKLRDSDLHRVHVQGNFDFLAVQEVRDLRPSPRLPDAPTPPLPTFDPTSRRRRAQVTDARPGKYPATAYDVNPHVIQFVLNGGTRIAAPVRDNMRFVQDQHSNAIFYDQTKWAWVESMQVMRNADPDEISARPGLAEEVEKYTLAAKFRHIATGVHVWVVSVHLKAIGIKNSNIAKHQPEVNNWLRRVLAKVGADEDTMIVAGGDFNDNAHDALMRVAARDTQNLIAAHNRVLQPAFAHRTNTHIAGNSAPPPTPPAPPAPAQPPTAAHARGAVHETDLKHRAGAFFGRMVSSTHSFDGLYSYNKVAVDVVVPGRVHGMDLGNAHSISDHCLIDWTIRLKCPACAPPPLPRLPGLFDEDEDEGYAGGLFDEDEDEEDEEDEDEEEDRDFDEDDEPLFQNDLPPSMMSRGGKLEALLADEDEEEEI